MGNSDIMKYQQLDLLKMGTAAALALFPSTASFSEDGPLHLEAEFGVEYDDNITIDSIDSTSSQGDSLFRLNGAIAVDVYDKDDSGLTARYSFFQSYHQDLKTFDLQIHGFSARAKTKVGKVNLGADYRYDYIRLDGQNFLDVHTLGTDIGLLAAKNTYLTAGYEYRTQSFDDPARSDRNADRHSLDTKLYFLLGKEKNITVGYKLSRQNANIDSLTYWGHTFDAGLKLPVKITADPVSIFRLRYRYRQRDYSGVDPVIGAARFDKRHTFRALLEIPFLEVLTANLEYRHVISNSNLAVVDFTNNSVRASVSWSF